MKPLEKLIEAAQHLFDMKKKKGSTAAMKNAWNILAIALYDAKQPTPPPDVEAMADEVLKKHTAGLLRQRLREMVLDAMTEMYQLGQASQPQDAAQEDGLPTNIPDGDGDWKINQKTFTRSEVFKILFTQRSMITNDLKTSCWDELAETAKNIILNPRKPKI